MPQTAPHAILLLRQNRPQISGLQESLYSLLSVYDSVFHRATFQFVANTCGRSAVLYTCGQLAEEVAAKALPGGDPSTAGCGYIIGSGFDLRS